MNYLGIDLGTSNSVACTIQKGKFVFLKIRNRDLLPSCILYKDGKITIGELAKSKAKIYSDNYISSSKTYIGQPVGNSNLYKEWTIDGRLFTPTDVATEILTAIKKEADRYFDNGEEITAVITIPAYFTTEPRAETKKAAERAGFIVKQIISEPVAAAVAYGFENDHGVNNVYVIDIGGGTFDVTLLKVDNINNSYDVLMKDGNQRLGGDDFDNVIMDMFFSEIRQKIGIDLSNKDKSELLDGTYSQVIQKLMHEAEKTKISLSESNSERVEIPNLFIHKNVPFNLDVEITADKFIKNSNKLLNEIKRVIRCSIEDNNFSVNNIDRVILVGGTSKLPAVYKYVKEFFGKKPYADKDLSKLVAMGAALISVDEKSGISVKDIIAHSLGIEVVNDKYSIILPKNSIFPIVNKMIYTTVFDNQTEVDICVYEGEDTNNLSNNTYIGEFTLDDIKKAPQGVPQIEVEFVYDKSMILNVTAKDLDTKSAMTKELTITKGEKKEKRQNVICDFVIMLDSSYSMNGDGYDAPIEIAKRACIKLASDIIDLSVHKMGLITFGTYSDIKTHLTNNRDKIVDAITPITTSGSTNMFEALNDARVVLSTSNNVPIAILVTDGAPDEKYNTTTKASELKACGIRIITIGVGGGVNSAFLAEIASSEHDYYYVDDMEQLASTFQNVISALIIKN